MTWGRPHTRFDADGIATKRVDIHPCGADDLPRRSTLRDLTRAARAKSASRLRLRFVLEMAHAVLPGEVRARPLMRWMSVLFAENTREDRALADALAFTAPEGWTRPMLALLIGVRDNDFHGVALGELPELGAVHLGPTYQSEHCLRAPEDDLGIGDEAALAACRAFILGEVTLALAGDPNEPV